MAVTRYKSGDPRIQGRDVVLASEFDLLQNTLDKADRLCGEMMAASSANEATVMALQQQLSALRARSIVFDTDAALSDRLKAAGMITVEQILAGTPMDAFLKHAGVCDLDTFSQWVEMRRAEYLKMHARFALEKREDDELFDWITAHTAAFGEVMINFKAAMQPPQSQATETHDEHP